MATRSTGLWAACVLPGEGPEFRFTTRSRNPWRVLRSRLQHRRWRREVR